MGTATRRLARHVLGLAWLVLVGSLLALSAATHLAGHFDRQIFIVRGGSMAPTIPLGSIISVRPVDPSTIREGDVVTLQSEPGAVLTHRVIEVAVGSQGGLAFQTKGDANGTPDAHIAPASTIIGAVETYVPMAGYALAFLATPSGLVSALAALGALLLARWAIDESPSARRASRPPGRAQVAGHG